MNTATILISKIEKMLQEIEESSNVDAEIQKREQKIAELLTANKSLLDSSITKSKKADDLEKANAYLEARLRSNVKENVNLQAEVKELKAQLAKPAEPCRSENVKRLLIENNSLNATIVRQRQKIDFLIRFANEEEDKRFAAFQENKKLTKEIVTLQDALSTRKFQTVVAHENLDDAVEHIEILEFKLAEMQKQLTSQDKYVTELKGQITGLLDENQLLQATINAVKINWL